REGEPALIADVRRAGVEAFAERYSATRTGEGGARDGVEGLALRLLKRLAPLAPFDDADRELLAAAAVLCDTGRTVSLYRWPGHTLIAVLPPEVPLVDDEWYAGLVRACRRYLDRDLRATRLGD